MYKFEIKFSMPLFLTSLPLVLLFLSLCVGAFEFYKELSLIEFPDADKQQQSTAKAFKLDMQASLAMSGVKNLSIKGLGRDDAEVYALKISKKKTGLSSLFSKLKSNNNNDALKIVRNYQPGLANQESKPNYSAFLSKGDKAAMNEDGLRKMIKSKTHLFRGCYNKMLLKDGLLSGVATITIDTYGKGSSIFKGVGRTKVINELKRCLNSQVGNIDFSDIEMTKAIRFSLNFSS